MFAGAFSRPHDSPYLIRWMYEVDFIKHAIDAILVAIFGWNREKLPCDAIYCHFRKPGDLLKFLGVSEETSIAMAFASMSIIWFVLHISTYFNMRRYLKN
jgi:hypothetical protein